MKTLRRYASQQASYGQTQCANAWPSEAAITRASNTHASRLSMSSFQYQGGLRLFMKPNGVRSVAYTFSAAVQLSSKKNI
jgi:hypothetical protein